MKNTEPGFWGMASGYLLMAIGIFFLIISQFDTPADFRTHTTSSLCLWLGIITVLTVQRKQRHAQNDS